MYSYIQIAQCQHDGDRMLPTPRSMLPLNVKRCLGESAWWFGLDTHGHTARCSAGPSQTCRHSLQAVKPINRFHRLEEHVASSMKRFDSFFFCTITSGKTNAYPPAVMVKLHYVPPFFCLDYATEMITLNHDCGCPISPLWFSFGNHLKVIVSIRIRRFSGMQP